MELSRCAFPAQWNGLRRISWCELFPFLTRQVALVPVFACKDRGEVVCACGVAANQLLRLSSTSRDNHRGLTFSNISRRLIRRGILLVLSWLQTSKRMADACRWADSAPGMEFQKGSLSGWVTDAFMQPWAN